MKKCVTFGEVMMRLNPPGYMRIVQSNLLEVSYAGGELNVAVCLANLGQPAEFVTKLPDNELGRAARMEMQKYSVITDHIAAGGDRLGIYFVEKGASVRSSKVVYDRKDSSVSKAFIEDFDWNEILKDTGWFHFTGITPALGGELPRLCELACKTARKKGIMVSCDLNYRSKLWSRKEAEECMSRLMPYVDLCIANEEDASDVFGIKADNTDLAKGKIDKNAYISVAKQLCERFSVKKVAVTLRGSISASDNTWAAMLYDNEDKKAYFSDTFSIHIVDRVGGGDSFVGALIYALMQNYKGEEAIQFAAAASALKQTIEHDYNIVTLKEVQKLAGGNGSGRVER